MTRLLVLIAISAGLGFGQSSTPIAYPDKAFSSYQTMEAQAVPTSTTVITTSNLIIVGGWISCVSAQTVTITDGNSKSVLPGVSVTANQIVGLAIISGAYVSKGFSIAASGSGCTYSVWWRQ